MPAAGFWSWRLKSLTADEDLADTDKGTGGIIRSAYTR